jgi:hypothetical protein
MSDTQDAIKDAVEHGRESHLNSIVAILVAVTATFMALCNIKDGNITQAMAQAQSRAVDTWSYYQAKSTKQSLAEAAVDQLVALKLVSSAEARPAIEKMIADNKTRVTRYEKEKGDIKREADGYQKMYDELNTHDDQFDLSEAALSVCIALFGVTALTQKRWLLGVAGALMAIGFFFALAGFFAWKVHPDALFTWLS